MQGAWILDPEHALDFDLRGLAAPTLNIAVNAALEHSASGYQG